MNIAQITIVVIFSALSVALIVWVKFFDCFLECESCSKFVPIRKIEELSLENADDTEIRMLVCQKCMKEVFEGEDGNLWMI